VGSLIKNTGGEVQNIRNRQFLHNCLAQIVRPDHQAKYNLPPDQLSESDGEKPAGELEKYTRRTSICPSVMPSFFFLCHVSSFSKIRLGL